jgi:uncharacterized membrane protein YozB (DUF420 family)
MFVVLSIFLFGLGYGLLIKSKDRLKLHRWSMSMGAILASVSIFLVMLPTLYNFLIDPNLELISSLSIFTLIHAIIGVPAITIGLIYAFGDLPQKTRSWMRWAAVFWVASLAFGILLFLEMMGYLPF